MLCALLLREANQLVIIHFPKLKNANSLAEQVRYEARLSSSWHDASRSVGVIISIAQKISIDDIAISSAIERVEGILGEQVHHRILPSYSMLVMFTLKVQICNVKQMMLATHVNLKCIPLLSTRILFISD